MSYYHWHALANGKHGDHTAQSCSRHEFRDYEHGYHRYGLRTSARNLLRYVCQRCPADVQGHLPKAWVKGDMMMTTTRSDLLALVYRFYPRGLREIHRMHVAEGEPVYEDTEEHCALVVASARGRRDYSRWEAMCRRLEGQFSLQNESLHLLAGGKDPAYSARIWLTNETALSLHLSLLGPYYGIHLPGLPEEKSVAEEVVREIEFTYPGYAQIPPEIGNEVVPDVVGGVELGKATIYTCLFSQVWTWVQSA